MSKDLRQRSPGLVSPARLRDRGNSGAGGSPSHHPAHRWYPPRLPATSVESIEARSARTGPFPAPASHNYDFKCSASHCPGEHHGEKV